MSWYTRRYETHLGELEPDPESGLVEYEEAAARIAELEAELATLRAENAHLKRALELVDALRNKERNLPL